MTEEQIKEKLSQHYVELLASRRGFKCSKPDLDEGVDLTITRAVPFQRNGRTRYLDSGAYIDVQLKSTCENQIVRTSTGLKYKLEAKTWNDLVDRRASGSLTPLILVLLVLPDDGEQWITVTPEQLVLRRLGYWFRVPADAEPTENTSRITIEIPDANALSLSFLEEQFAEAFQ